MKTRVLVGLLLVPVLILALYVLPPEGFLTLLILVGALCAFEFLSLWGKDMPWGLKGAALIFAMLPPLFVYLATDTLTMATASFVALFCILGLALFYYPRVSASGVLGVLFAVFVLPLLLSSLLIIVRQKEARALILLPFLVTFGSDIFAYFVGSLCGKHKLIPKISPKKTWEGSAGALFGSLVLVLGYGWGLTVLGGYQVSYPALILLALLGSVVAQVGDLSFSLFKRAFDIKDYGKLLPGHGGALDRFDSLLLAAPVTALILAWCPNIVVAA